MQVRVSEDQVRHAALMDSIVLRIDSDDDTVTPRLSWSIHEFTEE